MTDHDIIGRIVMSEDDGTGERDTGEILTHADGSQTHISIDPHGHRSVISERQPAPLATERGGFRTEIMPLSDGSEITVFVDAHGNQSLSPPPPRKRTPMSASDRYAYSILGGNRREVEQAARELLRRGGHWAHVAHLSVPGCRVGRAPRQATNTRVRGSRRTRQVSCSSASSDDPGGEPPPPDPPRPFWAFHVLPHTDLAIGGGVR